MLAYAIYIVFVGAFIAIAALGHMLLFSAICPNLFGTAADPGKSEAGPNQRPPPRVPTIAA